MYKITASHHFDSAHFLAGYQGKCANLHGHRWTVEATVWSRHLQDQGQNTGMVIDFNDLKKPLKDLCNAFDHAFVYERDTLKTTTLAALKDEGFYLVEIDFRPTAECMAKYFYDHLKALDLNVYEVTVYETPTNYATYSEVAYAG